MSQYLVQLSIVCASDVPFDRLITEYDPLLLQSIALTLKNEYGGVCEMVVEQCEMSAAEEFDEE